jgi:hypothetical protein
VIVSEEVVTRIFPWFYNGGNIKLTNISWIPHKHFL